MLWHLCGPRWPGDCMTPGKKLPDISVVLAVRNSEDVIGSGTRRVVDHLRELDLPFEVLGVNAGSWDTSFKVLRLLAAEVPELRLIEKDMTGRAFIRGVSEARGAYVVLMDAARLPTLAVAAGLDAVAPGSRAPRRWWCAAAGSRRAGCRPCPRSPGPAAAATASSAASSARLATSPSRWWEPPAAPPRACSRRSGACWQPEPSTSRIRSPRRLTTRRGQEGARSGQTC